MDLNAIILLEEQPGDSPCEALGGSAPACCDVLGRPVLHRILEDLKRQGVTATRVISASAPPPLPADGTVDPSQVKYTVESDPWRAAESEFTDLMQANPDAVLVLRIGPYVELDVDALLQHHFDQRCHVTAVCNEAGESLGAYVVTASRRNDAAYMFRHKLEDFRSACGSYCFRGYWNWLRTARDLRALAIDGLLQRNRVKPAGQEIRPGVWMGEHAHIAKGARVLAPVYLGAHSKIQRNAVITRCSVLEHHAVVESGTVVENSTVLPYTHVGGGLDVSNAVIGNRRLVHLLHDVEVAIEDPKLIDIVPQSASWRTLGHAAALATFLPAHLFRGMFAKSHRERPAQLPAAVKAPSSALNTPAALQAPAGAEAARFPSKWS